MYIFALKSLEKELNDILSPVCENALFALAFFCEIVYNDMRYKLNTDRGFLFPNDGWWRSYEPDIIKRGENCIASTSINNKYNGNNHYWQREKNILLRRFVSKYDFRAYQFFF